MPSVGSIDTAYTPFAKVLLDLSNDIHFVAVKTLACYPKRLIDRRQVIIKFNVNDRTDDLNYFTDLSVTFISHLD